MAAQSDSLLSATESRVGLRQTRSSASVHVQAAKAVARRYQGVSITVFSDRDIASRHEEVEAALSGADAFFGSLLFDYDQVYQQLHIIHQRTLSSVGLILQTTLSHVLKWAAHPVLGARYCLGVGWTADQCSMIAARVMHSPQSHPPTNDCHLQVEWLRERIQKVPVRLVFESALELMGTTQLGSFQASDHMKTKEL